MPHARPATDRRRATFGGRVRCATNSRITLRAPTGKRGEMLATELLEVNVFDPDLYANGDPAQNGFPTSHFARLREGAPCVRLPCDIPGHETSAWVLSRYEDVSAMLREPDRFLSGNGVTMRATHTTVAEDGGKPAMITMDGDA